MPTYTSGSLTGLTIDDLANWANISGGDVQSWISTINSGGYAVSDREAIESLAGAYCNFYKSGDGTYTITSFKDLGQVTTPNAVNSNLSSVARGEVQVPVNVSGGGSGGGTINMSTTPASGSFGQNALYFLSNVNQAVLAAQVGIMLGKQIDYALYNANPDYWDSIGMSSLNPETWNSITNGDDSLAAGLFNMILGLNPDTGKAQTYLDANAVAYAAYALKENAWFNKGDYIIPDTSALFYPTANYSVSGFSMAAIGHKYYTSSSGWMSVSVNNVFIADVSLNIQGTTYRLLVLISKNWFSRATERGNYNSYSTTRNGTTYYYADPLFHPDSVPSQYQESYYQNSGSTSSSASRDNMIWDMAYIYFNGTASPTVPGVSDQTSPSTTFPDTSTWTNPQTTLTSLQQQYPQLFQDALVWDNVQPDGTNPQLVYLPVPMTNTVVNNDTQTNTTTYNITQPITNIDESSQTNPQIDITNPSSDGDDIVELITRLIQQMPEPVNETEPETETETELQPTVPPSNPVDTGTGDSPTPVAPSGSASALWSVYHPTQQQVDDFGGWLWTGNIITQIQQLLQNPMDGIITLHKIFATPVDSGTGTIVVGRLDSNVSSATVSQQYVEVDCGSVSLNEQYGNVFDYEPYTSISLYLPFIGIVPLNVIDTMRSTINVKYGVDVFTGACLAMVIVTRDGHTVNMYQYTGVASVEYPLTGSVHSGLVNGLLGIAGGVVGVASAATGVGAVAGASAIAGGIANFNRSSNAKSGSFSGNAGAMGIKVPYLIIERPQTKLAQTFPTLDGYPTNYSVRLGNCSNHVVCKTVHVSGISATEQELSMIESILKSGVEI